MSFIFNIAKGMVNYYATTPGASDALIIVPLELSGLESEAGMIDHDTLAAVLAGSSAEQTSVGRLTLTATSTVDDANNWRYADFSDTAFTGATGNAIGALLVCYEPSSGAADSAIIPLTKHDFVVTPNTGDISVLVPTTGFYRAT